MTARKIIIVTGANRGIGRAICDEILRGHSPVKVYACSRAGKDLGLNVIDNTSEVQYPKLDITNSSQIQDLVSRVKSTDGYVDCLINNAGTHESGAGGNTADNTMKVNYFGTLAMCQAFLPLVGKNGRIVNVSSTGSLSRKYPKEVQDRLHNPKLTLEGVDSMIQSYLGALQSGRAASWGNAQPYSFSKSCMNAMTTILAQEHPDVPINCCCPGWVDTEMGSIVGNAPKSPEEGARIPIRLALGDIGSVSGKYWSNPGVSDTGYGDVVAW